MYILKWKLPSGESGFFKVERKMLKGRQALFLQKKLGEKLKESQGKIHWTFSLS